MALAKVLYMQGCRKVKDHKKDTAVSKDWCQELCKKYLQNTLTVSDERLKDALYRKIGLIFDRPGLTKAALATITKTIF